MQAAWDRADAAEKAHAEKMQKKEQQAAAKALAARTSASVAAPAKKTQRIVATRDKRAMQKARQIEEAAEGEAPQPQLVVQRHDGTSVDYASAVEDIQIFLRHHGSEATLDEVGQGVGIDLHQLGLLDALRHNPRIEAIGLSTGERLKYQPPFGVRNRSSLAHMLSRAFPGSGEAEAVLRSELNAEETYDGVDVDVDELLAQGRCVRVDKSDKKAREFVLFAAPAGRPASEEVRELWKAERVPEGAGLRDEMIKRKLVTKEEFAKREERKNELRRKAREASAQPKKQRVGQIRKWANTHLGDADELEALSTK